jgi:serine/threonine-protein kinase
MHANGVLHRDLKPSNIGLASSGAPKLLDFGLAALTGRSEEYPFAGTPAYLPPEAYEGAVADASFDVWALAIVLAEAIIGHHPYTTGKSRPGDVALGSDLVTFFNRALAISPDDRFQTATDVRAALMNANASR